MRSSHLDWAACGSTCCERSEFFSTQLRSGWRSSGALPEAIFTTPGSSDLERRKTTNRAYAGFAEREDATMKSTRRSLLGRQPERRKRTRTPWASPRSCKEAYYAQLRAFLRKNLLVGGLAPAVRRRIFAAVTARGGPVGRRLPDHLLSSRCVRFLSCGRRIEDAGRRTHR